MKKLFLAASSACLIATTGSAQENGLNDGHLSALDADGNASISSAEFKAFAEFAFKSMDLNQDGSISRSEMLAHTDEGAFARADADGNGSVSKREFEARMDANFEAADKDGDGQLD